MTRWIIIPHHKIQGSTSQNQGFPGLSPYLHHVTVKPQVSRIRKGEKIMGGWITFCFGGVIGFCLGIICIIWLMAMGESELYAESLETVRDNRR
jgi:hypothetical protein